MKTHHVYMGLFISYILFTLSLLLFRFVWDCLLNVYFRLTSDRGIASDRCIRCYTHWKLVCMRYVVCMNDSLFLSFSFTFSFSFLLISNSRLVYIHFRVYSMNKFYSSDCNQHHRSCDHIFKCFAETFLCISFFFTLSNSRNQCREKSQR